MNWPPRLRTVLVTLSLVVFILPLVGILGLRVYESELIRRTEAELISQGALIQAAYKKRLEQNLENDPTKFEEYGKSIKIHWPRKVNEWLKPIPEKLQLAASQINPPLKPAKSTTEKIHPAAVDAGKDLRSILLDSQTITLSGTHIVNPNGDVVASTHSIVGESIAHLSEIDDALEGQFVQRLRRRDTETDPPLDSISRGTNFKVTVAMPIVENGRLLGAVMLLRTPMSLQKAIYRHRYPLGIAIGLMVLGVIGISLLTSYFISQPIKRLVSQTEKIENNEGGETPIDDPRTFEIEELSKSFSEMATALRKRREYIESFAQNVSHEFKSPLSSIQGTVELLDEHWESMDKQKRRTFLNNLHEDGQRLENLLDRLLTLARADSLRPGNESIDPVAKLRSLSSSLSSHEFTVAFGDSDGELPEMAISEEAFDSILTNLVKNAKNVGASRVDLTADLHTSNGSSDNYIDIRVKDNGPGISKANADKIFQPFFTSNEQTGTGLGLSIVESLLEVHAGEIELLEYSDGTVFRIRIPTK